MQLSWNNVHQNKPALFDWLVFTLSLLLGLIYPGLSDLINSASFSGWMLTALVLYSIGLLLKRRPLYYRLEKKGWQAKNVFLLLFLVIGHWVIMLASVIIAEDAFLAVTGQPPLVKNQPTSGWETFINIFTSLFITFLAFKPVRKQGKALKEKTVFCRKLPAFARDVNMDVGTEKKLLQRELVADIILISAVTMLSFVFWQQSIVSGMGEMRMESFSKMLGIFIFLGFAYMMIYLPLRYLYFIEDDNRQAWRRLLIIFLLILVRVLFETLRG